MCAVCTLELDEVQETDSHISYGSAWHFIHMFLVDSSSFTYFFRKLLESMVPVHVGIWNKSRNVKLLSAHLMCDGCRPNCLQIILHGLNQVSYYYICADNPDLALVHEFGYCCCGTLFNDKEQTVYFSC